jgi:uncharacterized membrane protein YkoI
MKPLLPFLFAVLALPALASDDHDRARAAVQDQLVLPLMHIAPRIETKFDARLLNAELEDDAGGYFYELELITADGRLIEVKVDAASGEVTEVEQQGLSGGGD